MSLFNIDDAIDKITEIAKKKIIDNLPATLESKILYDAGIEGIDLSKMKIYVKENKLIIDLSELNDYCKQLLRDIYLPNGLKRRKW